ncbi:MAG: ABC transporter permease, partial [Dermatophilaceae bacterium]
MFAGLDDRVVDSSAIAVNLQQTAVPIAVLAIGQTLVILTAGIDLAVGATTVLSMMVMASLAADSVVPGPVAIVIGIALGVAAGFLNGILITRLTLPPFIVTLGTLSIFTAIALLYSGGSSIIADEMP